jgi:arylsulfatase A-like enzyme
MKYLTSLILIAVAACTLGAAKLPNIVYIMSDELAYYELSHMGNPYIKTPNIDRMAEEGIRFTQALAGSPVCAPLRCNLMTGKHAGHASVRANDGGTPLREDEVTIATVLKEKGYATGGFGKWGAGGRDSTGVPEKHGFDVFFGYYDQVHAHAFYPKYIIRNSEEVPLPGNKGFRTGKNYSHYKIMEEGLKFIRENKDRPFFAYFPITPPHGMYDIPKKDPAWRQYKGESWMKDPEINQDCKNYAAMVTMVDNDLQSILDLLRELEIEDNTIVFFTGDNGGQDRFASKEHPRGFYAPNVNPKTGVEFRGGKGNLYEGGLRIPFIVRWPGKIEANQVSDLLFYQPDVFPTLAELAGARIPKEVDGLSFLPTLTGAGKQRKHKYLYWEYRDQVAVRQNYFKAIHHVKKDTWELYNLKKDISETTDLSARAPQILTRLQGWAKEAHEEVRPGTFTTRERHERDRQAKWGDMPQPVKKPKK